MATRYVLDDDLPGELWQRVRNAQVNGANVGLDVFAPSRLHDGLAVDEWMDVRRGEVGKGLPTGAGAGRSPPLRGMDGPSVMNVAAPRGSGVGRSTPKGQTPLMSGPRGIGVPRPPEPRGRAQAPPDPGTLLPSTLSGLRHPNAISPIDPSRTEVFQPGPDGKLHPILGWHTTGPGDVEAWRRNIDWGGVGDDLGVLAAQAVGGVAAGVAGLAGGLWLSGRDALRDAREARRLSGR